MKNTTIALAAACTLAAAMPSAAQAHCQGCGFAAGAIGGLAAGAIVGSAIANSRPVYVEPAPVYVAPPPVYVEPPAYVDGPVCHIERQQVWDGYAYRMRRVQVCD
jgi:PXPV repeat (3 copies)